MLMYLSGCLPCGHIPKAGKHDEEHCRVPPSTRSTHVVYTLNDYDTFKLSPRLAASGVCLLENKCT